MRRNYYGKTIIDFARTSLAEIMAELVKPMGVFSPGENKEYKKMSLLPSSDFANLTILASNSIPHITFVRVRFHQFFNSNVTRRNGNYLRNVLISIA